MLRLPHASLVLVALMSGACGETETADPEPALANPGPARFIGSAACRDCHAEQFSDWMGSHHQLAMQVAGADTVVGDFDDASVDYFGTTTRFFTRGDDFYVQTADASGEDQEFRIAFTFGVAPLQQYLIERPGGRLQALAFSWDTRAKTEGGQRWFHLYPDEYIAPDDALHWTGPQQNWNYMCAECHSTNVDMGFDAATHSFDTTYSEISVGCEACHGPGSTHVEQARAGVETAAYGLEVDLDDRGQSTWIMNAQTGIAALSEPPEQPQLQPEACGRCHARRGIIAPDYEYGQPLAHTHMPALLEDGLYFADGQILDEVYVYGSFLQSRMYRAGVTCTDCHDPHSNQLVTGPGPNQVCTQCHMPSTFAAKDHAGHEPEQAGCVDCHMRSRTYMVVDDRRDHSFRIPRPDLTEAVGTPNACADCHADRDAAWAAARIGEWRGPDGTPPRPHFAPALDAGRRGYANTMLRDVANDGEQPGIARATAISLLAEPFGSPDFRTLGTQLGSPDPLIRIAALRRLRTLPPELRLRLPGSALLDDPVRGVRIEAAVTYAGISTMLPADAQRAWVPARREFFAAYRAIANRPEALLALAAFERQEGNVNEAIELYERALGIEPRAATARVNLADTLRGLGDEERAEAILREGLALDGTSAALHHSLGLSLIRSGERDAALAALRRAAELAPDNPRYAYVVGVALHSLGQPQGAVAYLRDAYGRFDTDYDIAMGLATMLRDSGDTQGALDIAYALARRHPEDQNVVGLLRTLDAIP